MARWGGGDSWHLPAGRCQLEKDPQQRERGQGAARRQKAEIISCCGGRSWVLGEYASLLLRIVSAERQKYRNYFMLLLRRWFMPADYYSDHGHIVQYATICPHCYLTKMTMETVKHLYKLVDFYLMRSLIQKVVLCLLLHYIQFLFIQRFKTSVTSG